jgi:hypothetical protein
MFRNKRGIALAVSFLVIVVLLILGSVFIVRSISEKTSADKERRFIQAFYLAEAGGNEALNRLDVLINTDLMLNINSANPQSLANSIRNTYCCDVGDGVAFLVNYTKESGTAQFTLTGNVANSNGQIANLGQGTYQYVISVTENGPPRSVTTDVWEYPYNFKITSTGTVAGLSRKVISSGDFTVRVQHDNFARYALFDVHHAMPSGTDVWFKNTTNFSGPVHSNDQFRFYGNPSGTFDGLVTQHLTKAKFYNQGDYVQLDADNNSPYDVPVFNAGFQRGVDEINLESSITQDDLKEQAQGGEGGSYDPGIYVNTEAGNVKGGIYVKGDATVEMGKDASNNATYRIVQGGTTKIITVTNTTTTVQTLGGSTDTYNGKPDGIDNLGTIIYVDGGVDSLKGTVQKDSQVTVSSQNDIVITDNISYEEYNTGPPPSAVGKTNLLGILSWGGNVRVGAAAPNNVTIHGTVMARNGVFTADDYSSKCYPNGCGIATLLGGAITNFYGAFGTFNGATGQQLSGYGRNFVYDERMAQGNAPPYFPSMRTFTAFTNDITDKLTWQEGGI